MHLCCLKIKDLVMKRVYCQSPEQMSPRSHVMYREKEEREGGVVFVMTLCPPIIALLDSDNVAVFAHSLLQIQLARKQRRPLKTGVSGVSQSKCSTTL